MQGYHLIYISMTTCFKILGDYSWSSRKIGVIHSRASQPTPKTVLFQFSSVTRSCPTLCNPMNCSTPGSPAITDSWSLLKLMSIELVMPINHLILCVPFSSHLQSFPPASGYFPRSQFFTSGGQRIGVSALAPVPPMNIQE